MPFRQICSMCLSVFEVVIQKRNYFSLLLCDVHISVIIVLRVYFFCYCVTYTFLLLMCYVYISEHVHLMQNLTFLKRCWLSFQCCGKLCHISWCLCTNLRIIISQKTGVLLANVPAYYYAVYTLMDIQICYPTYLDPQVEVGSSVNTVTYLHVKQNKVGVKFPAGKQNPVDAASFGKALCSVFESSAYVRLYCCLQNDCGVKLSNDQC